MKMIGNLLSRLILSHIHIFINIQISSNAYAAPSSALKHCSPDFPVHQKHDTLSR